MQSIAFLGLSISQSHEIIMGLDHFNYSEGPLIDKDFKNHNVWIFGYNYEGDDIYIKLSDNFDHNIAKCISFHYADYAISYPYKGETK